MAKKPTTSADEAAETALPERIKRSSPPRKMRAASPKKALRGSVANALKPPGPRKVLQSLAFARLAAILRKIAALVGVRAVPVIALILLGWVFRRIRRRS